MSETSMLWRECGPTPVFSRLSPSYLSHVPHKGIIRVHPTANESLRWPKKCKWQQRSI